MTIAPLESAINRIATVKFIGTALLVLVSLFSMTAQAGTGPCPSRLDTAPLKSLPVAVTPVGELWHLNEYGFGKSFSSENGTRTVDATVSWPLYSPETVDAFVKHPKGWEFRHVSISCLNSRIEARRTGTEAVISTAFLEMRRLEGFIERRMTCLIGSGSSKVYKTIVANSRYLAFVTAEPGFVFFDTEEGKFLPWALTDDNPSAGTNLYVDQAGALYVDNGFDPLAGRKLRRVVLGGRELRASISKELICDARAISRVTNPYVDDLGRGVECK